MALIFNFNIPKLKLIAISSASKFYRPSSSKLNRVYTSSEQQARNYVESVN